MATVRIALQRLLHHKCQAVEAATHVGRAARQPHPRLSRQADHRPRARKTRFSASSSTAPSTRTWTPPPNSISIVPPRRLCGSTATGVKRTVAPSTASASCRRQLWITLRPTPYCRDTSDTVAPGSPAAFRMVRFSSRLKRRRRLIVRSDAANARLSRTGVTPVASALSISSVCDTHSRLQGGRHRLSITHILSSAFEERTSCCVRGIGRDSLSGTESQEDGADGRRDRRLV